MAMPRSKTSLGCAPVAWRRRPLPDRTLPRALYLKKVSEGAVNNPCYFAMDATRPGGLGCRFYVICEANRTFRALPSGHGNGLNLTSIPDFSNGIRCAKNFSNARDSS